MRVNEALPTHAHATKGVALSDNQKRMIGVSKLGAGRYALPKDPRAAAPLTTNRLLDKACYRTGDGDNYHQPQRPGSDHSNIQSKGFPC